MTCFIFLFIIFLSLPAFSMTYLELDKLNEIISQGQSKEFATKYEEEAKQLEKEGNLKKAAEMYFKASRLERVSGNYQKGLLYGEKARELADKTGHFEIRARSVYQVARSYEAIADFDKALHFYEEASVLLGQENLKGVQAESYARIGRIYRKTAKLREALEYQKKAYAVFEILVTETGVATKISPTRETRRARAMSQNPRTVRNFIDIAVELGDTYAALNDFKSAADLYDHLLKYAYDMPDKKFRVYLSIGNLQSKKRDHQKALEYHMKALELADAINIPRYVSAVNSAVARDYQKIGKLEDAVTYYKKAVMALEDERSMLQSGEMRTSFATNMVQTYDGIVSTLSALGRTEESFNFSERGRARAFLDILGNRVDLSRGKDSSLTKDEEDLKMQISELASIGQENDADISGELEELTKQYAQVLEKLRKSDPEHASLVSVAPMTLTDLQAMLKPGQTVIEFHVLNNETIAWLITRDQIQSAVIKQSKMDLVAKISDYRESIESITSNERSLRMKTAEKTVSDVEKIARELYLTLMGNFKIDPGQELIVVPHDILHYLPFHTLVLPDGKFLLEENLVSYLSSASLMKFTAEKRKKSGNKLIAFGNPDLGNPAYDLKYAEKEVNKIKTIYPQSEIYLKKEATRKRALNLSGNFDMIHFATHGEYDDKDPLASALRLSPVGDDDGKLTTEDIFKMRINASLVVLSACETALGKIKHGDEVIGFTRAFIYAGTPSVVTTLWQVSDVATYILMGDFYQNLRIMRKADALRTAQLNLMKKYHHPFFWGAFVLTGDPE